MDSIAAPPDYLSPPIRGWAADHQPLLEMIVTELLHTGGWPEIGDLTRRLARQGQPVALRDIFWHWSSPGLKDT
jgi:hypothetical protein